MKMIFIISSLLLVACSQQEANKENISISATACAEKISGGKVIECKSSEDTEAYLDRMLSESSRINKEYPGPTMPGLDHLFEVQRITNDGEIYLNSGLMLKLAGVICHHPDLARSLKASFISPFQHKVSFKETGYQNNGMVFAYVWEVNTEFGNDLGDEALELGPTISSINENALTSGWCDPVIQKQHNYHKRYSEIAKLAE